MTLDDLIRNNCPSWAVVGAEVVCIDADMRKTDSSNPSLDGLVKGEKYTLTWVGIRTHFSYRPTWSVHVAGLRIEYQHAGIEHLTGYSVARFAPVVKKTMEQDVQEHFTKFLENTREKEITV